MRRRHNLELPSGALAPSPIALLVVHPQATMLILAFAFTFIVSFCCEMRL
jgi:hypothetical protein